MAQIQLPQKWFCSQIKLSEILQSLLPPCTGVSVASQSSSVRTEVLGQIGSPVPGFRRTPWQALCLMQKENERHMVRRAGCHSSPHGILQGLKLVCVPSVLARNLSGHQEAIPVLLQLIYSSLSPT